MGRARHFFIKIDQFIFARLDQLKNEASFQKLNELLLNLNDEQQKLFAQLLVFTLILIPYLFSITMWWSNSVIKKRIETKNQIIEQIAYLSGNKDTLNNISSRYLSTSAMLNKEDLENRIVNIASRHQIGANKLEVQNFNVLGSTSSMSKIEAKINFHDFGTNDFSNFTREIIDIERFKIVAIDLKKNNESNLLQGTYEIRHIGRNN